MENKKVWIVYRLGKAGSTVPDTFGVYESEGAARDICELLGTSSNKAYLVGKELK